MPRGDRTGPMGQGSMTGRAAGFCAGNDKPGFSDNTLGRGFGQAGGRGRRNRFFANGLIRGRRGLRGNNAVMAEPTAESFNPYPDPQEEIEQLVAQAKNYADALENVNQRIKGLNAQLEK